MIYHFEDIYVDLKQLEYVGDIKDKKVKSYYYLYFRYQINGYVHESENYDYAHKEKIELLRKHFIQAWIDYQENKRRNNHECSRR